MFGIRFRDVRVLSSKLSIARAQTVCNCMCINDHISRRYSSSKRDKSPIRKPGKLHATKNLKLHAKPRRVSPSSGLKRPTIKERIKKPTEDKTLFAPLTVDPVLKSGENEDIGTELAGKLTKEEKAQIIKSFYMDNSLGLLASQHRIEGEIFESAMTSFRKYCVNSTQLPVELHIVFRDLVEKHGHVSDLFPFFLEHTKIVFPHLDCIEDLQKISDLTEPSAWYPLARSIQRKIIFHAGPTNSGKTYHALKRFMESKSGVYCGPLRLLAMEVYDKCRDAEVDCDLITGETRSFANEDGSASDHVACTVEMTSLTQEYDVAVIDEIQMIGDLQRGWSWTRALLGIAAKEVHVCGEETAINLVKNLLYTTHDSFEVREYKRLTSLTYLDAAVGNFDNIKKGDCIVCFSKKDIFRISNILSAKGYNVALIYGDLPPGTKIVQSRKFNDPNDPTDVLVATDAVGMGLNLSIKRIIFYSLMKFSLQEDDRHKQGYLTTSQAQQIGGRAGRFRTQFEDGEVTTFWPKDVKVLKNIVNTEKTPLEKAGMHPTTEMIEMFSYHLPKATLSNLLDIFVHVCKLDDIYFMCNLKQFKELGEIIQHVPLPLRTRCTLCSSPLKIKKGMAQVMFVKIATEMSKGVPMTYDWLCRMLGAPFVIPRSMAQLEQLEGAFDVVDIYLWLSYRYPDLFVDADEVRQLRMKLDSIIQTYLSQGMTKGKSSLVHELYDKTAAVPPDDKLLEQSPLQAYTPKPKPKRDDDKHRVFANAYKELERIEQSDYECTDLSDPLPFKDNYTDTKHSEKQKDMDELTKDLNLKDKSEEKRHNLWQFDEVQEAKTVKKEDKLKSLFSGKSKQYNAIAGTYASNIFSSDDDGNIERNQEPPNVSENTETDTVNEYEAYVGMDDEELEALKKILTISKEIKKHKMEHQSPVMDQGEVRVFGSMISSDKEIPKLDTLVHILPKKIKKKQIVKEKYFRSLLKKDTLDSPGEETSGNVQDLDNVNTQTDIKADSALKEKESVEQKLLKKGVSAEMLEKLKKEWQKSTMKDETSNDKIKDVDNK